MSFTMFKALLINTLQKEMRNKTLIFLFFLSFAIIILMSIVSNFFVMNLQMQPNVKFGDMKISILYGIISMWGGIIGAILGVSTVKSDMEYGVSQQIIAFPIKPFYYLLTRLFGSWLIVNLYYLVTLLLALFIFSLTDNQVIVNIGMFSSFMVYSFIILVSLTLAAFYSMHFPKVMALVSTMVTYLVIVSSNYRFIDGIEFESLGIFSSFGLVVHYIFPRLNVLNDLSKVLLLDNKSWSFGLSEGLHFLVTYSLLLILVYISFRRKDYQDS